MSDYLISVIRTVVPAAVAAALSWLAIRYGIVLDEQSSASLAVGLTAATLSAYYAAARALERRYPWVGVLLGHRRQPSYQEGSDRP